MAKRIQRKRTKGWRMPPGAVSATRPGKWGNPFRVGKPGPMGRTPLDAVGAVGMFEDMLRDKQLREAAGYPSVEEIRQELRGKDIACFCELDAPCHVDVILKVANATIPGANP